MATDDDCPRDGAAASPSTAGCRAGLSDLYESISFGILRRKGSQGSLRLYKRIPVDDDERYTNVTLNTSAATTDVISNVRSPAAPTSPTSVASTLTKNTRAGVIKEDVDVEPAGGNACSCDDVSTRIWDTLEKYASCG